MLLLIPFLPLLGFAILSFFGKRLQSEIVIGSIATAMVAIPFVIAGTVLLSQGYPQTVTAFHWFKAGSLTVDLAYSFDQLSILFTLIITGIGTLIHVYSIGYMHGDRSFFRFFAYLNLFIFMMLNLVLADNFVVTFLGWEGVGLASYLLIGFWYERRFDGVDIVWTGDAAKKAFVMNRIGDVGMLVAMFLVFLHFGSLRYSDVNAAVVAVPIDGTIMTIIALCLFLGATGKSAQLPLYTWLPDAMAGPTPVSALIHAATMVTSGIFLLARCAPIFALSPTAMNIVAYIGVATALFAATMGLVQNDIKKVLAYSTVSQLGFMFAALGVGATTAAIFHVTTHAFFKACLFLGAGSVIHGMHEEQDIQKMGGLRKYMPVTYSTFLISSIAIAGIFPFSGFFSKDEILWNVYDKGSPILWGGLVLAAFCTAFYMFRLLNLTFGGKERFDVYHTKPHESPVTMTFPLVVLSFLAMVGGLLGIPHALGHIIHIPNVLEEFLLPVLSPANQILHRVQPTEIHSIEYILMLVSLGIGLLGIAIASSWYRIESDSPKILSEKFSGVYRLLWNKYFVDELYGGLIVRPLQKLSSTIFYHSVDTIGIDGLVNSTGTLTEILSSFFRRLQTGIVQRYALFMMVGIALTLLWLLFA